MKNIPELLVFGAIFLGATLFALDKNYVGTVTILVIGAIVLIKVRK